MTIQADAPPDPTLGRLAKLLDSNDALMDELNAIRSMIARARSYLDEPGCNARLVEAHLERCRARHSAILAKLRANRAEALGLLGDRSDPS